MLKTHVDLVDSDDALLGELVAHGKPEKAAKYFVAMVYETYYTMQTEEWCDTKNKAYRDATNQRTRQYIDKWRRLFSLVSDDEKRTTSQNIRLRYVMGGMPMERQTYSQWLSELYRED